MLLLFFLYNHPGWWWVHLEEEVGIGARSMKTLVSCEFGYIENKWLKKRKYMIELFGDSKDQVLGYRDVGVQEILWGASICEE